MAEVSSISVELVEDRLTNNLRAFAWGNVYEITYAQRPAILVLDQASRTGTLYEYLSNDEFEADRRRVLSFGDGMAGAGVVADRLPPAPVLSGSAAQSFPPGGDG